MASTLLNREIFLAPLAEFKPCQYVVALSAGVDSVVLLHALKQQLTPEDPPLQAIHINHGLQKDAHLWAQFCQALCQAWQIPLKIISLEMNQGQTENLEAKARALRYQALFSELKPQGILLTAHHEDDQAETMLLQLLRGAGPKGLAAMPLIQPYSEGRAHYRPLLTKSRSEILSYAKAYALKFIDDPSNAELQFDRNYLRHAVLPLLQQRWPAYAKSIARSAHLSAELCTWAKPYFEKIWQDCAHCYDEKKNRYYLDRRQLRQYTAYEISEIIRYEFERQQAPLPHFQLMQRILNMVYNDKLDSKALVQSQNHQLRVYRDRLYLLANTEVQPRQGIFFWDLSERFHLPDSKLYLEARTIIGQGIRLSTKPCEIRFRVHGERFHPAGRQGSHPLKKLFQEWDIPPWQRGQWPLIYQEGKLLAIPNIAYSAMALVGPEEPGMVFSLVEGEEV